MGLHQTPAERGQGFKSFPVIHERNTRKVDFQKLGIFTAISGAVQYGIDVTENLFRFVMMVVFQVHEGAKLGSEVFSPLVVLSLRFVDEKMVILVFVRFFVSGGVVEVEGEKIIYLFHS